MITMEWVGGCSGADRRSFISHFQKTIEIDRKHRSAFTRHGLTIKQSFLESSKGIFDRSISTALLQSTSLATSL